MKCSISSVSSDNCCHAICNNSTIICSSSYTCNQYKLFNLFLPLSTCGRTQPQWCVPSRSTHPEAESVPTYLVSRNARRRFLPSLPSNAAKYSLPWIATNWSTTVMVGYVDSMGWMGANESSPCTISYCSYYHSSQSILRYVVGYYS